MKRAGKPAVAVDETSAPKDIFGREFKVGDTVVYTTGGINRLFVATVSKVTAKKIRLHYVGSRYGAGFIKDPAACVIVDGEHVDGYVMWKILQR